MAINTDPRRDPGSYESRRYENSNTMVWVVLALIVAGLVAWLIYATSTDVSDTTTGPAAVTEPETPATTPAPAP